MHASSGSSPFELHQRETHKAGSQFLNRSKVLLAIRVIDCPEGTRFICRFSLVSKRHTAFFVFVATKIFEQIERAQSMRSKK
jgi:hypothetical protein